jgi:hypothetical protein
MRKCIQCKENKLLTEFHASSRDSAQWMCIPCAKTYHKAWQAISKARPAKLNGTSKVCRDCGLEKPYSQFGKRSIAMDKKMSYCKPCWIKRSKIATAKHKAKVRVDG